jgi:hypothetical protein
LSNGNNPSLTSTINKTRSSSTTTNSNYNINTYYQSINKIQYSIKLEKEINKNILNKKIIIKYYGTFIDERIDKFTYGSNIYRPWQYQIKNGKFYRVF